MDWGVLLFVLALVFLVGHLVFDGYRMFLYVRRLRHVKYENLDIQNCDRCSAIKEGLRNMRHEAIWTAAAVFALGGHIALDFT